MPKVTGTNILMLEETKKNKSWNNTGKHILRQKINRKIFFNFICRHKFLFFILFYSFQLKCQTGGNSFFHFLMSICVFKKKKYLYCGKYFFRYKINIDINYVLLRCNFNLTYMMLFGNDNNSLVTLTVNGVSDYG